MRVWTIVSDNWGRGFDTFKDGFVLQALSGLEYMMDIPDAAYVVTSFDELDFGERSVVETVTERYEPAWSSTNDEQVLWSESHFHFKRGSFT